VRHTTKPNLAVYYRKTLYSDELAIQASLRSVFLAYFAICLPAVLQKPVLYSNNGQVATKLHKLDEIISSVMDVFYNSAAV
tara:strand:+ start:26 stop:268 length:243 start_codon:yes stop_codon:yes gene_type:complete